MVLRLQPRGIVRMMIAAAAFLVAAHLGVRLLAEIFGRERVVVLTALFHLDLEANIPTWYSSTGLLIACGMLALVALNERRERTKRWRSWAFLTLIFLYLSIDETARIHEPAGAFIRETFHTRGLVYHAWVIPALVGLPVLAAAYWRWFVSLPAAVRRLAALAAAVYLSGAMGLEMFAGLLAPDRGEPSSFYSLTTTLEETLEMIGVAIWIYALARYAAAKGYGVTLEFSPEKQADERKAPASPELPTHSAA